MNEMIDLGFAEAHLPAGTHICQIYNDDDERNDSLLRFLQKGLELQERAACFTDGVSEELIDEFLNSHAISLEEMKANRAFSHEGTSEVYYKDNRFDPERMIELLTDFYQTAEELGFSGARVIGEMTPEIGHISGGERLLEYESMVSMLLRDHPITTICQYNAHSFDGATIMDVLKVHPMMVVRGTVVHNPFFIPPEEFLSAKKE